jgi:2'-5' RNA ligase
MIKKQPLLLLLLMALHIQSGVYVLADLSKEVAEVIRAAQDVLSEKVAALNKQDKTDYIFQSTQYFPHLSLAFVSQEELPIQEVKQKFAGITEALKHIAENCTRIDISKNFEDTTIDYWPGKFEVVCGDSKKRNYLNVVLKASHNSALVNLAQAVGNMLQEKYNVQQRFPFSTHITIGRIYDRKDTPIDDIALKQRLEDVSVIDTEEESSQHKDISIVIDEFKLKGHGSEERFMFLLESR